MKIAKLIVAIMMWGFGAFLLLYCGQHLGIEMYEIKGTVWIVGAILLVWMPSKEI